MVLDDVFHRVQLITNISGCRSQITAITLCPSSGRVSVLTLYHMFYLPYIDLFLLLSLFVVPNVLELT